MIRYGRILLMMNSTYDESAYNGSPIFPAIFFFLIFHHRVIGFQVQE